MNLILHCAPTSEFDCNGCASYYDTNDDDIEESTEDDHSTNSTKFRILSISHIVGSRAWLNVFACLVINLSIQTIKSFNDMGLHDTTLINDIDSNIIEAQNINSYFKTPIGMFVMTKFGYKLTVAAGSVIVCASFTSMSFLDSGSMRNFAWFWKIMICGPAGLGVSFLKVCALIPILEHFTTKGKRMEALLISKLGLVLGSVIDLGVQFARNLDWQTLYRINGGFCVLPLVFALIMKDIKVKEVKKIGKTEAKKEERCESNYIIQCFCRFPVLKDKKLWTAVGVFSAFRFGTALPKFSKPKISKTNSPSDSYVDDLATIVGILLGIVLSYLLKGLRFIKSLGSFKELKHKVVFVASTISFACPIIGFVSALCLETVAYHVIVCIVLTLFKVLSENLRSETMADVFGRSNIRITEGLLHMFMGLSGLIAASVQHVFSQADDELRWKTYFKIGGGSLIITGLVSQMFTIYKILPHEKPGENSNYNKVHPKRSQNSDKYKPSESMPSIIPEPEQSSDQKGRKCSSLTNSDSKTSLSTSTPSSLNLPSRDNSDERSQGQDHLTNSNDLNELNLFPSAEDTITVKPIPSDSHLDTSLSPSVSSRREDNISSLYELPLYCPRYEKSERKRTYTNEN